MFRFLFDPRTEDLAASLRAAPAEGVELALVRASARRQVQGLLAALASDPTRLDLLGALATRDPRAAHRWVALAWDAERLDLVEQIAAGALRAQPGFVQAAEDLVRCWLRRGDLSRARALLSRAPAGEPTYQLLEAELLVAEGNSAAARPIVEAVCSRAFHVLTTEPAADTYWRQIEMRALRLREELSVLPD